MKKFIKVAIIVLLVLGVIGVTCYFFFSNLKKKNTTTSSIAAYLASDGKQTFNEDLQTVNGIVKSNGGDSRFDLIVKTSANLDSIMSVVASYYVENNTQIVGNDIAKAFNKAKDSQQRLQFMLDEYILKSSNSSYFNKSMGANDMYLQSCNYLLDFSKAINLAQGTINVNRNSNVKFHLFETYTNVVANTFNETNIEQLRTAPLIVDNASSINIMNSKMVFEGFVLKLSNSTSNVANNFDKYYSNCDKISFAKNLAINVQTVNTADQPSNEKTATFYLKSVFGM